MFAIYKRELKSYFCGMTGAIFTAFLLLMVGIYMTVNNLMVAYPNFEYAISGILIVLLLLIPIISMRSVSEDIHTKTSQLLYALPLKLSSVVLAKYFALLTVLAIPTTVMCLYPLILSSYGTVNFASAYGAILAFFLLGAALLAIGLFLSSLTESQVIAAVMTFGVLLLMFLMNGLSTMIPQTAGASLAAFIVLALLLALILYGLTKNATVSLTLACVLVFGIVLTYLMDSSLFAGVFPKLMTSLALFDRFNSFTTGLFDVTSLVYYLSVAALFVFFTVQSMEKKRFG